MGKAAITVPARSVLVVDDDQMVLEALCDELSEQYRVASAPNAEVALSLLAGQGFDAIISDVRMPGMNGVELMRRIERMAGDPVRVLLTGHADQDAYDAAHQANGVYKLSKPWGDDLGVVLQRALESRELVQRAGEQLKAEQYARREAVVALQRLDRLAALGTLAAGIAHEMRSPLTYLQVNYGWLREQVGRILTAANATVTLDAAAVANEDLAVVLGEWRALGLTKLTPEMDAVLKDCAEGVQRLAEILENIRTYVVPKRKAKHAEVDVNECLRQAVRLVQCRFKHGVRYEVVTLPEPALVIGHEGELQQVLINLLVNGCQAMGGKGAISARVAQRDGQWIVEVEDSGAGVPHDVVPHLFETFFTTKDETEGNGLGLSISRDIIRRHGGDLVYVEREGKGALFVVSMPVHVAAKPGAAG